MDKNTIDTLKEFLPDYVLAEICSVNWCDFWDKEEKIEINEKETIDDFLKEHIEEKNDSETENFWDESADEKKEKKWKIDDIHDESLQMYLNEIEKNEKLSIEEENKLLMEIKKWSKKARKKLASVYMEFVVSIAKKYTQNSSELLNLIQKWNEWLFKAIDAYNPNIDSNFSDFAKNFIEKEITLELNKTNSIFDFIKYFAYTNKLTTKTITKEIRYWIINDDDFDKILKLPYFVFPVSISQISKLQDLLKDIETVFKWNDSKNFIPSFMQSWDDDENIFWIDEKINLLTILTINYLNNNWTQLIPENIIYHNLKLEKLTPELLKNPNFYKNFLINDTSNIETFIQSLDNKKTRFLKYYLIELSKNISDNKEALSKIYFLLNNYLKEVKAEKTNINIFQYKDLRNIFAIIKEIIEWDIKLKKVLLEKINDLYEIWLFQKMIISFNSKDWKLFDDLKNRIDEKIYNTIHIDELNKYLWDKNKITWNDWIIEQKEIYLNEKIIYLKNLEKIKKKLIEIDNEQIKENILNWTINLSLDKKSNTIDEIREYLNINNLNNDDYKKYNWIIFSKKENFIKIKWLNKKNIIIWKWFIKEDDPDFEDLSTIELDNLSNEKYNISISLWWHNKHLKNPTDKDDMLTKSFEVLISSKLDHLEDIIRSTSVTPDFIIKIKENNEIIWSIFLDAKFSKYPFFIDENMDYAPVLKYYHELWKNFSTTDIWNNFPYKVIILFPWDKEAKELQKLNDYFQRQSNIVAVPMMVWDENILDTNLKYLEKYILEFIKEIEYKKKTN